MRLPSFRRDPAAAAPGTDGVEAARTRARRRLVGALALLVAGVVAFPLVFDTQPRPLSPDTPIVMPGRESSPAPRETVLPARETARAPRTAEPVRAAASAADAAVADMPAQAGAGAASAVTSAATAASAPPSAPRARPAAPSSAAATAAPAGRSDEGARARALLEGQGAAAATTGAAASEAAAPRFVVQVGAYSDAATLREARARVEKLGLKTYTQTVEGEAGKRTRVRVGPFATRDEALAAAARLKAAGLPANVLAL